MNDLGKKIKQTFKDKDYRHGYVDEFLNTYIATQIKVLRKQHGWSQAELAEHAGMKQSRISLLENVNYSSWSIQMLRKLAEAFDLPLCVSFEEFGKRVKDIEMFSREYLERNSFDKDSYFSKKLKIVTTISDTNQYIGITPTETQPKVVSLTEHRLRSASLVSADKISTTILSAVA